ncbi:MAG TPA: phosphatidate cytidylyltransferase, partial [Methylomirabilota bacterium]|nr:phosphatidate cytidylyltransferase [Methylomirabilota bacterium]
RGPWVIFVGLLSLSAFREYARAVGLWTDRSFGAVVGLFIVLIHASAWWPSGDGLARPGWYGLFMVLPVFGSLAVLAVPIARDEFAHMLDKTGLALLAVVYFGWLFGHVAYLVNLPGGVGLVLFLSFLVAVNDVAAFVVGKLAGRHPLRPRLSPGKTWEGALGGLLATLGVAWLARWLVPAYPPAILAGTAAAISLSGILGDLALSALKRDLGIKDWSAAIPGHGGILDRANSLVFAAPLFFHFSRYLGA